LNRCYSGTTPWLLANALASHAFDREHGCMPGGRRRNGAHNDRPVDNFHVGALTLAGCKMPVAAAFVCHFREAEKAGDIRVLAKIGALRSFSTRDPCSPNQILQ